MRFTGLHTKADIPSKAFQRLNKIAGPDNRSPVPNQDSPRREENDGKLVLNDYLEMKHNLLVFKGK